MRTREFLLIAVFCIVPLFSVAAQISAERKYDPDKIVRHALENALQVKHGHTYNVNFHIMDSLISHSRRGQIADPYGTLSGCILFSAMPSWESEDSTITGMYKNGEIIWDDYPGTKASFGGRLITTKDINNDGEVDILEAEIDHQRSTEMSSISYLWILSWNGTAGMIINDIDSVTHQSTLVSTDMWYDLADINRDGIMEIKGAINDVWQDDFPNLNPPTLPGITYSWNGNKYGFFPSAHQITKNEFYPADLMAVSVRCVVTKNNNAYIYSYTWTNQPASKQGIHHIYLDGLADTSSNYAPTGWKASSASYIRGRYFYNSTFDVLGTISPGHSLAGFGTVSTSRPAIVKYYVQGFRWFGQTATDEEYRNDILTNSVSGYTLGTSDTTQPSVTLYVLDSLKSYVLQSRSLGWITSQSSADTYAQLIDSAKAQLQRNDSLSAHRTLDTVMHHAVADSASVLVSEAFALIFFNAKYLLAQISPPPVGHIITATASMNGAIHPQGDNSVSDGGSLTFTIRPNPGYHIAGVFIDNADTSVGTDSIYTFRNVTAYHTISAFFAVNRYRIIAGAGDGGSIEPHDTVFVDYESGQSFAITANSGYAVRGLVVDGTARPAASTYTFSNVTSNHTITVDFRTNTFTITASAGAGGTIDPAGALIVTSGASQSFTITPNPGYTIGKVTVDGVSRGSIRAYTFTKIVSSHTISASFNQIPCLPPCCIDAPASVDRLTLTDANGNRKTLLVRNADRPLAAGLNDSLLAAQAGTGTLASGFQSRQSVESVSPGQPATVIQIWVREASYPLVLTVNENPQNSVRYWLIRPGQPDVELTDATSKQIEGLETGILEIRVRAGQPCQEQ
jgi:hypothetical protein